MASRGRRDALAVLAVARLEELAAAWSKVPEGPAFETIRDAETGLAMVRGRIGGGGAPFNLGEVTVTRAAVRMTSGEVGFGHVLGRDRERARFVARFDALWQSEIYRGFVENTVIRPVAARIAAEDAMTAAKTAATRVNFFTLVRGEDA